jgi:hypothetical protein
MVMLGAREELDATLVGLEEKERIWLPSFNSVISTGSSYVFVLIA